MSTKVCNTCKIEKDVSEFYKKDKNTLERFCKKCSNVIRVDRESKMRKRFLDELPKDKECVNCKCVKPIEEFYVSSQRRTIKSECIECFNKSILDKNPNFISKSDPEYKIKKNIKKRERRKNDPEYKIKQNIKQRERNKRRYHSDPEYKTKQNIKKRERRKIRYHSDPIFKFKENTRKTVNSHFKKLGYSKPCRTLEILGIDDEGLIKYIEGLFQDGMTWQNRGEWHTDHIVPVSLGDTIDEIKYLNHYTNLRPLWKDENLKKSNLIDDSNIELYNKFLKEMRYGS
jgi:hypothetical protein